MRKTPLKVGDMVLVWDSTLDMQWGRKLDDRYNGPYVIVEVHDGSYLLRELDGRVFKSRITGNRIIRCPSEIFNDGFIDSVLEEDDDYELGEMDSDAAGIIGMICASEEAELMERYDLGEVMEKSRDDFNVTVGV